MDTNIMAIQFHDQSLSATLIDSIPHVALKPICENIGLDWSAQLQKIKRNPVLSKVMVMITTTSLGEDGKSYLVEMLMLPIKYLNGWLFGVNVNKSKLQIRPKLIEYQTECFDVLASHFMPKLQISQNPQAPRAKIAVPGGLSLESQDLINDLIAARICILPKNKQGGAVINIRSALTTKYNLKGVKHGYKNIPDDQLTNVLNLIARLPLEGDQYLTYTKEELDLLIKSEVTKALPLSAKEGELMPASNLSITLNLPPLVDNRAKRFLITQQRDEMLTLWPLNDNQMVMTFDQAVRELNSSGEYLAMKKESVSIAKMVMDYIPAQHLPVLIETAGRRLKAIQS